MIEANSCVDDGDLDNFINTTWASSELRDEIVGLGNASSEEAVGKYVCLPADILLVFMPNPAPYELLHG
jgi:hypothetical protein